MIKILKELRQQHDNPFTICRCLFKLLDVKVSDGTLRDRLLQHPDFPSLLSIKDVLTDLRINTVALRRGSRKLSDFETPFVAVVQQEDWPTSNFTIIKDISEDKVTFYHPIALKWQILSLVDYESLDLGVVVLFEKDAGAGEIQYTAKVKEERISKILKLNPVFLVFAAIIFWLVQVALKGSTAGLFYAVLLLVSNLAGTLISIMLILYEVDSRNPLLREICGGSKKVNCNAILKSNGSDVFGVKWSLIGMAYFSGNLLSQLLFGFLDSTYLYSWMLLSFAATPYIIYSIVYQWKVAKQWCTLCLTIQVIIFFQFLTGLVFVSRADSQPLNIGMVHAISLTFIYLLTFSLVYYIFPLLEETKIGKQYKQRWQRMKADPEIFNALLTKQPKISISADGVGLIVGNLEANHEIIKVCNPYCGPCAKAHPEIETVIRNNPNVRLRIIFTADDREDDIKAQPVKHLMAIAEKNPMEKVYEALHDWYLAPTKNYEIFAKKYPMNGELKLQGDKLRAMRKWCDQMKIKATPTIYVNGYELPAIYQIGELKHFFS